VCTSQTHTTHQLWSLSITFLIEYTSHIFTASRLHSTWYSKSYLSLHYRLAYYHKLQMGANTPNSPSKDGNLPFGEKRQKIPTDNEMDAEFDVAPFRSSGLDTPMNHTSIAASHNFAKLDPKLQLPALPLSDGLPQNTTTNGGHTRSSSTDSSFVFQTLEHSRHNPSPTNTQTCLNNSESNAKPFALNPINLTDSDVIANAFLQYQAEFMTLLAHLSSTFTTSDHSVIHSFLHAQIITNTIQHHLRPIDQSINAVNNKLSNKSRNTKLDLELS
jgi:hypothetical protein